tara:strand:+ start:1237 stop:1776 length:540 start_codon:yes stop_codon:yes gene_type:complete
MSKLNYKLYKNFLPKKLFTSISNLHQELKFPWFYSSFVGYKEEKKISEMDRLNNFYFSSLLYEDGKIFNPHFNLIKDVLDYIPDFKQLIRIKSNLYTNLNKIYEHQPHIDRNEPHKTLILYLNTCNGFTRLEDRTIIKSVSNNALILDGNIYHNSSTADDQAIRLTVNINYKSSQDSEV